MTYSEPQAAALPFVSAIVPTFNRAAPLADCLAKLSAQNYPHERLEIIVVDNSSSDNTEEVVRKIAGRSPFPIHYFRKDNRGPAAARNYGIARARGSIFAFTDSDCEVGPNWVRTGISSMGPGIGIVAGPLIAIEHPERPVGFFSHHSMDVTREHPIYPTANIFYRREAIDQVGVFDEQFGAYLWGSPKGGEDVDLAWRVKRAGYRSAWVPEALVRHQHSNIPIIAWLIDPVRVQMLPRIMRKIPQLRQGLFLRLFVGRDHPVFYLAALGLGVAIAKRRPLALALVGPWLWMLLPSVRGDVWPPRRWWRVPVKYGLLFERFSLVTLTLVYASVRYRTLVL